MFDQLIQIGITLFAGACGLMVIRTVAEVLPELLGFQEPAALQVQPVPALRRQPLRKRHDR